MKQEWVATLLVRELESFKQEIMAFPDDASVWETRPGVTNSVGTLALHLSGNLQHFVGAVLAGNGYVRERAREFGDRGAPRAELVAGLDRAIHAIRASLSQPLDLAAEFPEAIGGKVLVTTGDMLLQLVAHTAFHLGQAGYLRRILTGESRSVGPLLPAGMATARMV